MAGVVCSLTHSLQMVIFGGDGGSNDFGGDGRSHDFNDVFAFGSPTFSPEF